VSSDGELGEQDTHFNKPGHPSQSSVDDRPAPKSPAGRRRRTRDEEAVIGILRGIAIRRQKANGS
jgi:hypothetical protein